MTPESALQFVQMIESNWADMRLFGAEHEPLGTADAWIEFLVTQDDVKAVFTAIQTLVERQPARPTVADLRNVLRKQGPMEEPPPEGGFLPPPWAIGKFLALAAGDFRVWPEQKGAYDEKQEEHPYERTYVWKEQVPMPEEARAAYEARAATLSYTEVGDILDGVLGAVRT